MNLWKTKGVLGNWKLWFSYMIFYFFLNQNFGSFSADFRFRAEGKKVTSRAELIILQLELWLEPARLGLITISYVVEGQINSKANCLIFIPPKKRTEFFPISAFFEKANSSFKIFKIFFPLVLKKTWIP